METASGPGPILVVDGDARPVGWADLERPGQVFQLGATFSPETDSLRGALDSALTSPFGLAVAVTADTGRYAERGQRRRDPGQRSGTSARRLLNRSRFARPKAAFEYEPATESDTEYGRRGQSRRLRGRGPRVNQNRRNERPNSGQPAQTESGQVDPAEAYAPPSGRGGTPARPKLTRPSEVSVEDAQAAAVVAS